MLLITHCRAARPAPSRWRYSSPHQLRHAASQPGSRRRHHQAVAPAAGVSIQTLAAKAIPETSDFIATIRSLRSTTVQPEGEGIVTKIFVKAGDHVRAGTPLVQIDPQRQQAAVGSAEANRVGTEADVEVLAAAGQALRVAARRRRDQPAGVRSGAELAADGRGASGGARRAGTRRPRPARLLPGRRHPVGHGRRDSDSRRRSRHDLDRDHDHRRQLGLEAYIQVPLDRSPDLRVGLPVQLLDADGKVVATNPLTFVAPRVDDATQTVLAKSALKQMPPSVRVQQFVRARIVWRTVQALTVPVTAVTRISGQYFGFVAEPGPQGGLVAKQRPLQVGEMVGNDYVVKSGVKAGDRLIVSGIQKLGDGAPVQPQ